MSKTNAMLVNPTTRSIERVHCVLDDINSMYALLSQEARGPVDCFDAVPLMIGGFQCIGWVDDEGGLKPNDYLWIAGRHLAGNVLVTGGSTSSGDTKPLPPAISADIVAEVVKWTDEPIPVGFKVYRF